MPVLQQWVIDARLMVGCDSRDERDAASILEQRVRQAIQDSSVDRLGGLSLGESRHLIQDAWLFDGVAPAEPRAKRAKPQFAQK